MTPYNLIPFKMMTITGCFRTRMLIIPKWLWHSSRALDTIFESVKQVREIGLNTIYGITF